MNATNELRLPALELRQGRDRVLYSFAVDGKMLPEFTTVSRLGRGEHKEVLGYQRPEVLSHIAEIRAYLESDNPILPNAIVIAFDRSYVSRHQGPAGHGLLPHRDADHPGAA